MKHNIVAFQIVCILLNNDNLLLGSYRTGKSYFMNKLAGDEATFRLGSTVNSETKGIWMHAMHHPKVSFRIIVVRFD